MHFHLVPFGSFPSSTHFRSLALSLLTFYLTSSICTICSSIFHVLYLVTVSVKQKDNNNVCVFWCCVVGGPPTMTIPPWTATSTSTSWTMVMVATSSQQQLNKYRSVYVIELRVVYFWCAKLEIHLGLVRNSVGCMEQANELQGNCVMCLYVRVHTTPIILCIHTCRSSSFIFLHVSTTMLETAFACNKFICIVKRFVHKYIYINKFSKIWNM